MATIFEVTITPPSNAAYFNGDLVSGYVQITDSIQWASSLTEPHTREGDKVVNDQSANSYNATTGKLTIETDSDHTWAFDIEHFRFQRNLDSGRIPYEAFCSFTSGDLVNDEISHFVVGETLFISEYAGATSGYPSRELQFSFVQNTFFGSGNLKSKIGKYTSSGSNVNITDKYLVAGFPGYETVFEDGGSGVFSGKSFYVYDNATGGTTSVSGVLSSYDVTKGRINISAVSGVPASGRVFLISGVDLSFSVNNFLLTEADVHGRYGQYQDFKNTSSSGYSTVQGNSYMLGASAVSPYNHLGYYYGQAQGYANLSAAATELVYGKAANGISSITMTAGGAGYTFPAYMITFKRASGDTYTKDGIAIAYPSAGAISANTIVIASPGEYSITPTPVLNPSGPGAGAIFGTVNIGAGFYDNLVFVTMGYQNYRNGLHSSRRFRHIEGYVFGVPVAIPAQFNRIITNMYLTIARKNVKESTDIAEYTFGTTVVNDRLSSGWDFVTVLNWTSFTDDSDSEQYVFIKNFRVDDRTYQTARLAGTHIDLTGNPAFSFPSDGAEKVSHALSDYAPSRERNKSNVMVSDFSFGFKTHAVARSRVFSAISKFQEYQNGSIQDSIRKDDLNVFVSPVGINIGNYHRFDAETLKIPMSEFAPIKAVAVTNRYGGSEQAIRNDQNDIIILCENGYKYISMFDNDFDKWVPMTRYGDACVATKSVVSEDGAVFSLGRFGIYMFVGPEREEISNSETAKLSKTIRNIDKTDLQGAIGVFDRGKQSYWVILPTLNKVYVFDFDNGNITKYSFTNSTFASKIVGASYVDGKVYLCTSDGVIVYYDETSDVDWDGTQNQVIAKKASFNSIGFAEGFVKIEDWAITYTSVSDVTVKITCDDETVERTFTSGTKKHVKIKVPRDFKKRGKRVAIEVRTESGNFELFDTKLNIMDVPQRRMLKQ